MAAFVVFGWSLHVSALVVPVGLHYFDVAHTREDVVEEEVAVEERGVLCGMY